MGKGKGKGEGKEKGTGKGNEDIQKGSHAFPPLYLATFSGHNKNTASEKLVDPTWLRSQPAENQGEGEKGR